jgi:hypothetical protein
MCEQSGFTIHPRDKFTRQVRSPSGGF